MSKVEITIPLQFIEAVEKTAEKNGITVDELTERAIAVRVVARAMKSLY